MCLCNRLLSLNYSKSREKRKSEEKGGRGVTKSRMAFSAGAYVTGEQCDQLIKNEDLLKKFKKNRLFVDKFVDRLII